MDQLKRALEQLNINYNDDMILKFEKYMDSILEWNDKVNLTAITDRKEFVKKHFIDSLACCELEQMKKFKKIIDVGTGAGFPGIPLAIIYPDKEFFLLDSLNKRIKIINEIKTSLDIDNVNLYHGRAEEFAHKKEFREKFDLCVSRAVANLSVLSEYCLPFVKVGGYFAAYKTGNAKEEIDNSLKAIDILGGIIEKKKIMNIDCFDLDHQIIIIKKIKNTISKYPRKAGIPGKEPLK
ncbi:16S rRNA (guanine(527)-N(7))-methyltransferase RsmG [Anaerovorax odorimutans]|uniref:16S rRNA (guanine(527)-N(7))-methyltransferase RsmG n=1 Tax=Anaerovorax odorimutans TaxID=109327 RepID=UPI0004145BD3|nr:16S rRNA (guanine(527)-N(7))-methyltransferase RsmG [Anaerovorax odorimutans]